jgi:hypothetical protein
MRTLPRRDARCARPAVWCGQQASVRARRSVDRHRPLAFRVGVRGPITYAGHLAAAQTDATTLLRLAMTRTRRELRDRRPGGGPSAAGANRRIGCAASDRGDASRNAHTAPRACVDTIVSRQDFACPRLASCQRLPDTRTHRRPLRSSSCQRTPALPDAIPATSAPSSWPKADSVRVVDETSNGAGRRAPRAGGGRVLDFRDRVYRAPGGVPSRGRARQPVSLSEIAVELSARDVLGLPLTTPRQLEDCARRAAAAARGALDCSSSRAARLVNPPPPPPPPPPARVARLRWHAPPPPRRPYGTQRALRPPKRADTKVFATA